MYIYIYVYIYTNIYIYTYTNIYIYTYTSYFFERLVYCQKSESSQTVIILWDIMGSYWGHKGDRMGKRAHNFFNIIASTMKRDPSSYTIYGMFPGYNNYNKFDS